MKATLGKALITADPQAESPENTKAGVTLPHYFIQCPQFTDEETKVHRRSTDEAGQYIQPLVLWFFHVPFVSCGVAGDSYSSH